MIPFQEQENPLTNADLEDLRNTRNSALLVGILVIAVFAAVSAGMVVVGGGLAWFSVLLPILATAVIGYMYYKYKQDVGYGKKICVKGSVTDKKEHTTRSRNSKGSSSTSTEYYLIIGGKRKITVSADVYRKYHLGDGVEIEMTKYSQTILAQRLIESRVQASEEVQKAVIDYSANIAASTGNDLTPQDRTLIRSARTNSIWGFLGWLFVIAFVGIFVVIFGLMFFVFVVLDNVPKEYAAHISQFLIYGVPVIVVIVLINWFLARLRPFNQDLAEGQKQIQTMFITDKFASNVKVTSSGWRITSSSGNYYYVVINARNYAIDEALYQQLDNSKPVRVHLAPHSKVLLRMEF